MSLTAADARRLERCVAGGGVAVFPADTVYGLACDPGSDPAVAGLYALKGRPRDKPAAIMFLSREDALGALPELGPRTQQALARLLPGAVTVLLPNPQRRFGAACGADPRTLGLRVPALPPPLAALAGVRGALLQSSANVAGGPDPRTLDEVPESIRRGADLVLDGGPLPGTPSTVVDLRAYEEGGDWTVVRAGAMPREALGAALGDARLGGSSSA